jgi:hypothetical protein
MERERRSEEARAIKMQQAATKRGDRVKFKKQGMEIVILCHDHPGASSSASSC